MTTQDLNSIEAASVVDARGSACPGPLLEAKKGIGKVKVGEVLEILSNDSATKGDIPIWANKVHKHRPIFCKEDKTLVMFRKWVRQFYLTSKDKQEIA